MLLNTIVGPSHFLVRFLVDETVCIIPKKNIVDVAVPPIGNQCQVKWSNGEILTATLLAAGKSQTIVTGVTV